MRYLLLALISPVAFAQTPKAPPQICIDEQCIGTPEPSPVSGIKWHPGHYMLTNTVGDIPSTVVQSIANEPHVLGIQNRYYWGKLEPQKGQYDFTVIENDLKELQAIGKRLVIQILDRTWVGTNATGIIPPDVAYYVKPDNKGIVAKTWEAPTMDRLIQLYAALGKRFDAEPYVEGITTEESTPGFSPSSLTPTYTRSALATQLKRQMTAARRDWPNTNVLVYLNYLAGEVEGLVAHASTLKLSVGGPDVVPTHDTEGTKVLLGYLGGIYYPGTIPIGYAVQMPELCGKEGCHLPADIFRHAVDKLKVTHLFWVKMGTQHDTATAKYSWQYGILPTIREQKGRINRACPAGMLCR